MNNCKVHLVFSIRISNSSWWPISPLFLYFVKMACLYLKLLLHHPPPPWDCWPQVQLKMCEDSLAAIIFLMLTSLFFQDFNWVSEQSNPKPWESFFELILDLRYFDIFQTTKMVESDARYDASDDERKTIFFCASAKKLVFGISCLLLSFEVDLPIFSYEEVI